MGKNERTLFHQHKMREIVNKPAIKITNNIVSISGDISNIPLKVVENLVKAVENSNLLEKHEEPDLSVENTIQENPSTYISHEKKSRKCLPCEQARIQTEKVKKLAKKRKGVRVKTDKIFDNDGNAIL